MSAPELFQTPMGRKFYEGTMPRIAAALELIAQRLPHPLSSAVYLVRHPSSPGTILAIFSDKKLATEVALRTGGLVEPWTITEREDS